VYENIVEGILNISSIDLMKNGTKVPIENKGMNFFFIFFFLYIHSSNYF
jgi:hypothetical protein